MEEKGETYHPAAAWSCSEGRWEPDMQRGLIEYSHNLQPKIRPSFEAGFSRQNHCMLQHINIALAVITCRKEGTCFKEDMCRKCYVPKVQEDAYWMLLASSFILFSV